MRHKSLIAGLITALMAYPAFAQTPPVGGAQTPPTGAQDGGGVPSETTPPEITKEQGSPEITKEQGSTGAGATSGNEVIVSRQQNEELAGDWIIGSNVISTEGETIGPIQDIIVNSEDGRVTAAIISVGGFLGIGAKEIAVSWDRLNINWDGDEILMDLTRDEAKEAEAYIFREREREPASAPAPETGGGGATGGLGGGGTGGTGGTVGGGTAGQ